MAVLIVAEEVDFLPEVEAALSTCGAEVRLGSASAPDDNAALCVYAFDGDPERLAAFRQRLGAVPLASVCSTPELKEFPEILEHADFHFASDAAGLFGLVLVARRLAQPAGIIECLGAVNERTVQSFDERGTLLDELGKWSEEVGARRMLRSALVETAEELLMNALYDAPVDETGRSVFADIEPKERVRLRSPRAAQVRFCQSETHLGLAVWDNWGRLSKATVLGYLERCAHESVQIEDKKLGAGLGLYVIANRATHFLIRVVPGISTEISCVFDRQHVKPMHGMGFLP
jgi:hypothetical protein